MGVKVNVGSGNTANITGYSVQEDSTPINPADSSGGVGQINVTVPEGSIDGSWHDTTAITRANLVTNPSFETNTTGWTAGSGVTLTRVTTEQKYGAYSASVACTGAVAGQKISTVTDPSVRKNNVYTASVWAKGEAGKKLRIDLTEQNSSHTNIGTTLGAEVTATGSWQRIQVSRKMGSTAAYADVAIVNVAAVSHTFYVDGVQLEQAAVATDFFDGNSQQVGELNYYWTGTVGNSISIERDGIIAVNNVLNPSMEVANTPDTLLRTNLMQNPSFASGIGVTYDWTDVANASISEKRLNGSLQRANLVINPSFETNTTNWDAFGGAAVITRDTTQYYVGTASAKVVCTASNQRIATVNSAGYPISKSTTYTASAYVKGENGKSVILRLRDLASGAATIGETDVVLNCNGSWQRVNVSRKMASNAVTAVIQVINNTAGAHTFYVDAVMLENSSTLNSYFDGSFIGDWELLNDVELSYSNNVGANGRRGYARVVTPSTTGIAVSEKIPVPSGVSLFNLSFYTKSESVNNPWFGISLDIYDSSDTQIVSGGVDTELGSITSSWKRFSGTLDLPSPTSTGSGWYAKISLNADNNAVYVDDILLEANAGNVSTYFDGDTTDTADIIYSWSGDSNNSTSLMKTRKVIVRQNLDINPSFETAGATGSLSNSVLNPSMEYNNDAVRSYAQRNYFMNPSFETNSGSSSAIDVNNCYNPGLRVDGTGWATVASTITATGARVVGNFASVGTVGFWRSTATNAATGYIDARYGSATTTYIPVTAGATYTASAYMRASYVSTSTRIFILWYDAAGAIISQPFIEDTVDLAANTYRRMSLTMTAPTGAVRAIIIARCYGTSVVGSTMDGGAFMMENAGTPSTTALAGNPGQYFDGAFSASGDFTYSWTTANASVSYRSALLIPNQTNANNGEGWQSSLYPSIGTKTFAVKSRYVGVSDYVAYAFPAGTGVASQQYTAKVTARTATGSFNLAYPVTIYEDGGLNRNLATIIPAGTTLTTTPTEYTVTFTTPSDVNANLRMLFRGGPEISQVVHYDKAFLTLGAYTGEYFDGSNSTGLDAELSTAWESTVNNSVSNIGAIRPDKFPTQGVATRSTMWSNDGTYSLRITPQNPYATTGNNTFAYLNSTDLLADGTIISGPQNYYTLVGTVRFTQAQTNPFAGRARSAILVVVRPSGTEVSMIGTQPPNTPGVYDIRGTFTIPDDATSVQIRLYNGDSYNGADVWWDSVGLFAGQGPYYGPYFDGSTTQYKWASTANNSKSINTTASTQRINHVQNPSFEAGTTGAGIVAGTGGSSAITSVTSQAYSGSASLQVVASGQLYGAYVAANTSPNDTYTVSAWVKGEAGKELEFGSTERTLSGSYISFTSFGNFTMTGNWQRVSGTITNSSTTWVNWAVLRIPVNESHTFYVDAVQIEEGSVATTYFDGSTTAALNELTYAWDTPGFASVSRMSYTMPATWDMYAEFGAQSVTYRTQEQALGGTYSMKCMFSGYENGAAVYNKNIIDIAQNTNYTVSAYIKGTAGRQVFIQADSQFAPIATSTPFTLTGGWDRVTLTFNSGNEVYIYGISIHNGDSVTTQNVFYVDRVLVEEAEEAGEWFSGNTTDAGDFTYEWTGVTDYSQSIQVSPTVANYTAVNCRAIHSGDWAALGTKSLRITPVNDSTDSYVYPYTPISEYAGKRIAVLGTLRLADAQVAGFDTTNARRIVANVVVGATTTTYRSDQAANTAGVTSHAVTFDIPANADGLSIRLYNGADEFGGDVWWDKFAIIEVPAASEWTDGYFDGSTSDYDYNNYVWTGTANASTSEKRVRTQETDYSLLLNDVIDLEDGAQGTTRGTINSVNYTDGMLSLAGDSRLAVFVAERSVQPYSGTLGGAFTYYLSLVGITTGFSIDPSIAGRAFKAQGWYGDMWAMMKQLCAAQRVEIALVSDNIVLRPIRTRIAENFRDISQSYSLQNTQLAERVEVYQYNNVSLNDAVVYPLPVWEWNSATKKYEFVYGSLDSNPQVYQVNADETITVEIPINTSIAAGTIKQPTPVDTIPLTSGRYNGTNSIYAIIDKEGKPYTAAQWIAGKGSVSVKVLEDTKTLQVKIKGAKDVDRGPFRIARASADATYAALYIVADGILANKELISFYTGAPIAKVGQEVGITIDNPFIDSTDEAYTALAIASAKYAHPQQTISIQTTGINRTDTSQNFRYPTFDEFATAQGVKTFAQFATDEAGVTFTAYDATWKTVTIDTFENQAFGNVNGARVKFGPAWYRIRSATLNESSVSYSAEVDTTIEDFNDDNPYLTFKEFNTRFAGKKFEDYALIPLWQS